MNAKGFTLVEMAVVTAVLVILAVVAMATYDSDNQIGESRRGVRVYISSAINEAARADAASDYALGLGTPDYLTALDNVSDGVWCTTSNPCFGYYLAPPYSAESAYKITATCYAFDGNEDSSISSTDSNINTDVCYFYDNSAGSFNLWENSNSYCGNSACNRNPATGGTMLVCHGGTNKTINIGAWSGHQGHGDTAGACP